MPALSSVAGVVTVDLSTGDRVFWLTTTESVTSWVVTGDSDGDLMEVSVAREVGHTVAWTGLVDTWYNDTPTLAEDETLRVSLALDGASWVAQGGYVETAPNPVEALQVIAHSASGSLAVDAELGRQAEVTATANLTDLVPQNLMSGEQLDVFILASGDTRTVDLSSYRQFRGLSVMETVYVPIGQVLWVRFDNILGTIYIQHATLLIEDDPEMPFIGGFEGYAGTVIPSNALDCDNGLYLRATYPLLFAAIGTQYNIGGELATEFRVPGLGFYAIEEGDHVPTREFFTVSSETSKFTRQGNHVTWFYNANVTGVTGDMKLSTPYPVAIQATSNISGLAQGLEVSPRTKFIGSILRFDANNIQFRQNDGSTNIWDTTKPFTWVSGDKLAFTWEYVTDAAPTEPTKYIIRAF